MDCVNHNGVEASAYCQNCGKPLCSACVCSVTGGQIFCQPCFAAWQGWQQPFVPPIAMGPNPSTAAVLGLIPGVGAMYNGQFIKGLIHVAIFAALISITEYYPLGGLFIAAWVIYQSFEAYYTARANRDGQPLPDPLGLNEVSDWLYPGARFRGTTHPEGASPAQGQPAASGYEQPFQPPYTAPAAGASGPQGRAAPGIPPPQPVAPYGWRQREPVGAILLIVLGVLFLLGRLNILFIHWVRFVWPLALIALGVWLIARRIGSR